MLFKNRGKTMYKPFKAIKEALAGKPVSRKDFGIGVLEGIALFTVGSYASRVIEQKTPANLFLTRFPTSIPNALSVEKYEQQDAKYCLVHIRQAHASFDFVAHEEKQKIADVQKDIYEILNYLIEHKNVKTVYQEGQMLENPTFAKDTRQKRHEEENQPISETEQKVCDLEKKLLMSQNTPAADPLDAERYQDILASEIKHYLTIMEQKKDAPKYARDCELNSWYIDGAVGKLEDEKKISTKPTEKESGFSDAFVKQGLDYAILKYREDYLLDLIAKTNNPASVTVFGSLHDWKDNIADWNKQHPDKKFSLIVITPDALAKNFSFEEKQ